jgi:small-conductance mechanosensitive channel/CheY-like chemotaxis protein
VLVLVLAAGHLVSRNAGFDPFHPDVSRFLTPAAWFVFWISIFRLINWVCRRYLLDAISQQWLGAPMPRLFGDVFTAVIFLVALALFAQTAFSASLVPLYATSGVLTIVLGLALQSIILDLFVGFAIHIDHPFGIGDWLRLEDGTQAEVIALTWRTVQLRSEAGETIYIPNSDLGRARFMNLSENGEPVRFSHDFILEYDVKPERGFRVMQAAIKATIGDAGVLGSPQPTVVIVDTNQQGTVFRAQWWMHPYHPVSPHRSKSRIITSVIEHLQAAGLGIALPITVSPRELPHVPVVNDEVDRRNLLGLNMLMKPLGEELVSALDPELSIRLVETGTVLSAEGDRPERISMLLEGFLVARLIHPTEGEEVEAYRLEPGTYFGEHVLDGGRPSMVSIVAGAESVVVDVDVHRVFELMAATPELVREVQSTNRTRQVQVYQAARVDRIVWPTADESETTIESVLRNLAGRARSIRPSKPRLLVVDDSRLQRYQLNEIAQSVGWEICGEASDGQEAVGLYRDLRPDLVTMDLVMPRMDGLQALTEIMEFHAGARVLMVSAVDQPAALEKALVLGALDFVVKPYDTSTLRVTLERLKESSAEGPRQYVEAASTLVPEQPTEVTAPGQ